MHGFGSRRTLHCSHGTRGDDRIIQPDLISLGPADGQWCKQSSTESSLRLRHWTFTSACAKVLAGASPCLHTEATESRLMCQKNLGEGSSSASASRQPAARSGDRPGSFGLPRELYDELRLTAEALLRRERPGHTLQATALVHEAILRLPDALSSSAPPGFRSLLVHCMRNILVDHARARLRKRRSGRLRRHPLAAFVPPRDDGLCDVVEFDDAVRSLRRIDIRLAETVAMRAYGNLGVSEIASALNVSRATVARDLRFARAWFAKRL